MRSDGTAVGQGVARPASQQFQVFGAWLAVALTVAIYHPILELGLLGQDTFPILAACAVHSLGDLPRIFGEVLMGGEFSSDFHRPVLCLSFAFDYFVWELDPFGYQLTTLTAMAACAVALFFFTGRLVGPAARFVPLVALIVFVAYPGHIEVLPAPSRRSEVLCALFSLLALHLQLSPRALTSRWPSWGSGFFALLAMGSKETAYLLVPLAFVSGALFAQPRGNRSVVRRAAASSLPVVVAAVLALVARFSALGGLGGHESAGLSRMGQFFELAHALVLPQPVLRMSAFASGLVVVAVIASAAAWRLGGDERALRRSRAGVFSASWLCLMLALHAYSGMGHPWYLFLPAVGLALSVGLVLDGLLDVALSQQAPTRRAAGAIGTLCIAMLSAWYLRFTPLMHDYVEWTSADAVQSEYLKEVSALVRAMPAGEWRPASAVPLRVESPKPPSGPVVRGASILRIDSLLAWTKLAFPDRHVRVVDNEMEASRGPADSLTVLVKGAVKLVLPAKTAQPVR